MWMIALPCWLTLMSVFSVCTVRPPDKGPGWLTTGVVVMVTVRLPCATAQGPSVTASFITSEPVRALSTTRAEGRASSSDRFSMSDRKATRLPSPSGMRTRTLRPSSACAVPAPLALLMVSATRPAVV